jgi:hypothetical protein
MGGADGQMICGPRHREIDHRFALAICKQLDIGPPGGSR